MFSEVSVILFEEGPHVTNTHDALDLTVQPPQPPWFQSNPLQQTWDMGTLTPSSDIWWPPLDTCSNYSPSPTGTDIETCKCNGFEITSAYATTVTYSWPVGGMHPTAMFSCFYERLYVQCT